MEVLSKLEALAGARVLIVGDVMLDKYYYGDSNRISPEAPVPVVQVERHSLLLGGAGNVARNIKSLGGEPYLVSVCGVDNAAEEFKSICKGLGISLFLLPAHSRKTTTKNRIIARHQQVLRFDEEDIGPLTSEHQQALLEHIESILGNYEVLILSDYGKGVINLNFMTQISELVKSKFPAVKILVDPKTPNYPLYKDVYILTPNAKETSEATGLPTNTPEAIVAAGQALMKQLGSKHLLATLSADGMALFNSPSEIYHIPTVAQEVFDVTGAGDTVIGVLGLCLAAGLPLLESCLVANHAAGVVVGEVGAATVTLDELEKAIAEGPETIITRWL